MNSKVIITFMCVFVLMSCIGCNKTAKKIVASDNNKSINKPEATSKKQPNEDIKGYKIKQNIIFYVLQEEYLENNDIRNPNVSELIRVFICYDGVENQIYPYSITLFSNKVSSIQEIRENLFVKTPIVLNLLPKTIVSNKELKKWELQNYNGSSSYTDESPKGLTYSKIK